MTLEERMDILEKEMAELKGQVSARPKLADVQFDNPATKSVKINDSTTAYLVPTPDNSSLLFIVGDVDLAFTPESALKLFQQSPEKTS